MALDIKLRGCDLVKLKGADVYAAGQMKGRASVLQSKPKNLFILKKTEGNRYPISCNIN